MRGSFWELDLPRRCDVGNGGKVWLVGAGPGDPGLITQRGKEILSRADIVLYDRLVNPAILMGTREGAKLVDAGKAPRGKKMQQAEIHRQLIRHAKKGARVVRLKGGDPFVFGRGGEEAEALAQAGVPFEVISGVTAGVAAPAYAGIPVTHRGVSSEIVFQIGNRARGSVAGKTLVGYMTVEGLDEFLQGAIRLGFAKSTPAGLISGGTCRSQRILIKTVGTLAKSARRRGVQAPAVVVVGSVVALRRKLAWWDKRPLAGTRIVLTASESLRKGWREVLEENGAEVWEVPMTKTEACPPQAGWIPKIHRADWLIFTSAAAVRAFPGIVGDWRKIACCRVAAVGRSTAVVLESIGLKPDWVGPGPGSKELAQGWPKWAKGRVLHLTGDSGSGELAMLLRKKGLSVERLVIYRNQEARSIPFPVRDALARDGADWVVFASGTAAERFRKAIPQWTSEPRVVAIGPATVRAARKAGWKVCAVAKEPSVRGVLSAILRKS